MNRRWPALLLIPALLLGALLFDQRSDTERARRARVAAPGTVAESSAVAEYLPVASPADALSSTWFCAGGTASGKGAAEQSVVISNPTAKAATGTVTAVPSLGRSVTRPVRLAAYSRVRIAVGDLVTSAYAAAQVEFRGGRVAVEHEVSGPLGIDAAPCASAASSSWYFASGATTQNAQETLVLFNPFLDPATVDISFATPNGRRTPGAYQGFQVPGRSVVATTINALVTVDADVSTSVIARRGRIVVDRIQTFDGQHASAVPAEAAKEPYAPKGLTIALGVPKPATTWMFPVGLKDAGAHERFVVYNPGNGDDAEVAVGTTLVDPKVNGEIDPIPISVPAGSYQVVEMDDEDRVPTRVDHSTVVVSTNRVPIVVDRMVATGAPFPARGTAVSSGTPLVAPQWLFASGGNVPDRLSERIAVHNPTGRRVTVKVQVIADGRITSIDGVGPVTLAAHQHAVIRFADKLDQRQVSVLVTATAPIAAERLLFRLGDTGMSTAVGIPFAEGIARVPASAQQ